MDPEDEKERNGKQGLAGEDRYECNRANNSRVIYSPILTEAKREERRGGRRDGGRRRPTTTRPRGFEVEAVESR